MNGPRTSHTKKVITTQIRFLESIEKYVTDDLDAFYPMNNSEELKEKLGTSEERE